jgi:hypothetical protein
VDILCPVTQTGVIGVRKQIGCDKWEKRFSQLKVQIIASSDIFKLQNPRNRFL